AARCTRPIWRTASAITSSSRRTSSDTTSPGRVPVGIWEARGGWTPRHCWVFQPTMLPMSLRQALPRGSESTQMRSGDEDHSAPFSLRGIGPVDAEPHSRLTHIELLKACYG